MTDNKTELGGLFYPTKDQYGNEIPFDSLFIPYIYNEIFLEGVYLDVVNGRKDMTIVDVGANIGVTVDYFRRFAKVVHAIEPSPEHFEALKKNKEFNKWDNVELHQVAWADKDGEMEFQQSPQNRTTNQLVVGEKHHNNWYSEQTFKVKTQAIESFFKENNIEKVDFMKFDPEGAEDLILRTDGFRNVCDKIKAIEIEFHHPTWRDLVKYLIDLGYEARQYQSSAIIVLFTRP